MQDINGLDTSEFTVESSRPSLLLLSPPRGILVVSHPFLPITKQKAVSEKTAREPKISGRPRLPDTSYLTLL